MTRKHFVYVALALAAGLLAAMYYIGGAPARPQLVYVACSDKRVYAVDLASGEVVARSNPIEGMGMPKSVVFVAETSRLYIGSQWDYAHNDYYPLVAVDVGDGFDVVGRYTLDPEQDAIDPSTRMDVYPVYRVVASETSNQLYLMYAGYGGGGNAIFDMTSERIVGRTSRPVRPSTVVSSDGSQAADVWPSISRTINGETTVFPSGVAVWDITTGEIISQVELEDNRGLQPPWETLSSPLLYRASGTNLHNLYDRDSGQIISTIDLRELTGMYSSESEDEPVLIEGTTRMVAPMDMVLPSDAPRGPSPVRGFLVVLDYVSGEIVKTIEVGPSPTTVAFHEQS